MSDTKNYVIGIIEIDPVANCPPAWVTLAGDDDTLDALLARLAGHWLAEGTPGDCPAGLAADAGCHEPKVLDARGDATAVSEQCVAANLDELSADLAERLAEIRVRLTAASRA